MKNKAFTLIELLVVVLIIGILAAIAVPQYQKAVAKSQFATLKDLTISLKNAQELYYLSNGEYASKLSDLDITLPPGTESTDTDILYDWGGCGINSQVSVACSNTDINLALLIFLDNTNAPRRLCYVLDNTNDIANQVCQQETGKTSPGWTSGGNSSYQY